jgi:hypothetical protein
MRPILSDIGRKITRFGASRRVRPVKAFKWLMAKWKVLSPVGAAFLPWIGAFLMGLGVALSVHSYTSTRFLEHTDGTVTENVATKAADGETVYVTHFRFRLPKGEIIAAVDPILSDENDEPNFAAGSDVPVFYTPANPQAAYIATKWRVYFYGILVGVLGIAVFDFGLILRFAMRRRSV